MSNYVGQPVDRLDARLKVTGGAKYSAEFPIKNLAYGVMVQSTIPKGHISNIDTAAAERAPGVIKVITYKNSLSLHFPGGSDPSAGKYGEKDLLPLQSERIFYDGQHIAIVVAETFEQAEYAAKLVKVQYSQEPPVIDIEQDIAKASKPKQSNGQDLQAKRGNVEQGLQMADVKIEETYTTPVQHHNPMEPHATIAEWNGDKLTIYDATQSVVGSRNVIAQMLGVQPDNVRLISLYLGGGFGCKGFSWPHSTLAAMAAKQVGRPVKIVLTRQQMFTSNGRRSRAIQKIALGADKSGKLTAVRHATTSETSFVDEFPEAAGIATPMLYATPNNEISHQMVRLNKGTPCPTRAPGEAVGVYALECAMDELAHQLKMDPVQFRLVNYAEQDPEKNKPFSGKNLRECYEAGAKAIGWDKRSAEPRAVREGKYLVGYGMATATYPANRSAASVHIQMLADGKVTASCATQDIGTGTYTILAQIAADALGIPVTQVDIRLGDTDLPKGPNSGGSQTSASAGPAVHAAALGLMNKLAKMASGDNGSPLHGVKEEDISAAGGRIFVKGKPDKGETYQQLLARQGMQKVETDATTNVSTRQQEANPSAGGGSQTKTSPEAEAAVKADEQVDRKQFSFHSFGAQFAKVLVDPELGTVRVAHVVSVMDIGKVLNLKTAKNQIMGGAIFGIGMALMEKTEYDPNNARVVTRDLAQYLVPVHADMPLFDVQFLDKADFNISPVGSRGIGEIGITGITAAIANAVYNATGKRVRELPITPDKLI
jgi:xanthine dehydrogenase YagR molybdenum-binding subunit